MTTTASRTWNAGKREPLADQLPRPTKRMAGRTAARLTPANIRVEGVRIDDDDRAYIRRRLGEKLGKYARRIERVTVRMRDVNGPRGGVDIQCRIKLVVSGLPSVVVEHQAARLRPALTRALAGAERAMRRTLQRRRTRPIRSFARGPAARVLADRIMEGPAKRLDPWPMGMRHLSYGSGTAELDSVT
jgi:hypothetical protein